MQTPHRQRWLESEELAEYLKDMRGPERENTKKQKRICLNRLAREYHQGPHPWWVRANIVVVALSTLLSLPAAFMKRAFIENLYGGNWGRVGFFLVAELAGIGNTILGARAQQRLTLAVSLWIIFAAFIALVGDLGSAGYTGGSEYGKEADNLGIASLVLKSLFDGFDIMKRSGELFKKVRRYTLQSGRSAAVIWQLFKNGPPPEFYYEALPAEERAWAGDTILNMLSEDPAPSTGEEDGTSPEEPDPQPESYDDNASQKSLSFYSCRSRWSIASVAWSIASAPVDAAHQVVNAFTGHDSSPILPIAERNQLQLSSLATPTGPRRPAGPPPTDNELQIRRIRPPRFNLGGSHRRASSTTGEGDPFTQGVTGSASGRVAGGDSVAHGAADSASSPPQPLEVEPDSSTHQPHSEVAAESGSVAHRAAVPVSGRPRQPLPEVVDEGDPFTQRVTGSVSSAAADPASSCVTSDCQHQSPTNDAAERDSVAHRAIDLILGTTSPLETEVGTVDDLFLSDLPINPRKK